MVPKLLRLREYRQILFFTGAGMSAESGIPTYRGKGGMWSQYNYEDYACQEAFDRDPERVWEFHEARRAKVKSCEPHQGHLVLAELEQRLPQVAIVTQNIDGMHGRAGSRHVSELHGSLWRLRCDPCGAAPIENVQVPLLDRRHDCGRYLRPDIVWFGDRLNEQTLATAVRLASTCDLFISVGTSAVVMPAAQLPVLAKQAGALLIEVNPEATQLSDLYDVCLRGPASSVLPALAGDLPLQT